MTALSSKNTIDV